MTTVKAPLEDGEVVEVPLADHWTDDEGPNVKVVKVRRFDKSETTLGRIDVKERVYNVRHHSLVDFIRWSDRTTALGIEELRLAKQNGCQMVTYLDEVNGKRYTISLRKLAMVGFAVRREKIGWRWVSYLADWTKS